MTAFVDRDNINGLIRGAGIEGDIGLLSVDIDGNDFWVLEAIDVVSPRILIVEYNSNVRPRGGRDASPTTRRSCAARSTRRTSTGARRWPRSRGRPQDKGYALVGSEQRGQQRLLRAATTCSGDSRSSTVAEAWRPSRFRESRGASGELTLRLRTRTERLRLMREMPVHDVESNRTMTIAERFGV